MHSFGMGASPVQFRVGAPIFRSCSPISRGTTSRASPVQVRTLPRAPAFALRASARRANFGPASIKVMQRTFNPQNRARYPGGPPVSDWIGGFMDCWSNGASAPGGRFPLIHHSTTPLPHFRLPGRLIVGQRPLKARMRVRFQPRQPFSFAISDLRVTSSYPNWHHRA